jgi:hypothetical protein
MGGAIGGIVGGLASSVLGGLANQVLGSLMSQFGQNPVAGAVNNLFGGALQNAVNTLIDQLPIPQFMKDAATDMVNSIVGNNQQDVDPCCQDAVNEQFSGEAEDFQNSIVESVLTQLQGEQGAEESGSSGGGSGQNWLVALASALGKQAGEHLKGMVDKGSEMGKSDAKDDPEGFAQLQSEFQAESQMFKMLQESISTMIKSIGEGLSSVARKQ